MNFRTTSPALILAAVLGLTACGGSDAPTPGTSIASDAETESQSALAATDGSIDSVRRPARTSSREAARVDSVKTAFVPGSCGDFPPPETPHDCGTVEVPVDYDRPDGAKVPLTVYRLRSAKPGMKLGTLFFNPGGPGLSAASKALYSEVEIDPRILERFDIVGVDPRGTGQDPGNQVRCYQSKADQEAALAGQVPYPIGSEEESKAIRFARDFARQCSTVGMPLAGAASTAQVARDMDVVRRVLGLERLSFMGISYGTYLGAVYANMFPDRFQAMVLHAAIDPVANFQSVGRQGQLLPPEVGQDMAGGAQRGLVEFLRLCDQAGAPACAFAGSGDSLDKWHLMMRRLKERPVETVDDYGQVVTVGQARMAANVQALLVTMAYVALGEDKRLAGYLQDVFALTEPQTAAAQSKQHATGVARIHEALRKGPLARGADGYVPLFDSYHAVTCADSNYPRDIRQWPAIAAAEDRRVPYFGPLFAWNAPACAGSLWDAKDEDRYTGPFDRRTASTILVVGNYYDPSTPYKGAVGAARALGNARLLSSDSWGHGAYGLPCVDDAVADYLLTGKLPARGKVCVGPQPFEAQEAAPSAAADGAPRKQRSQAPSRLRPGHLD